MSTQVHVAQRGLDAAVAEQALDGHDVGPALQQVGGERVPVIPRAE
jgi:hypothetical protein